MSKLLTSTCSACQVGSPLVTEEERQEYLPQIPEWTIEDVNGIEHLFRLYSFANFLEALAFTNLVGALAEQEGHHPELITEWGKVRVSWWTHKIDGLHLNDFVLAAKSDDLFITK